MKSIDMLDNIETVRYDAVDITREMLQLIHREAFNGLVSVSAHFLVNL